MNENGIFSRDECIVKARCKVCVPIRKMELYHPDVIISYWEWDRNLSNLFLWISHEFCEQLVAAMSALYWNFVLFYMQKKSAMFRQPQTIMLTWDCVKSREINFTTRIPNELLFYLYSDFLWNSDFFSVERKCNRVEVWVMALSKII